MQFQIKTHTNKKLGLKMQSPGTKPKSSLTQSLLREPRVIREMWGEDTGIHEL